MLPNAEPRFLSFFRWTGLIAVVAGAVGSELFMFHVGRHNKSRLLMTLFALWVFSPFAVLLLSETVSKGWSTLTRAMLHTVMLVLTFGSLATYGFVALGPPRAQPAFAFIVFPPASWLLIATVVPAAALISRKLSNRREHC